MLQGPEPCRQEPRRVASSATTGSGPQGSRPRPHLRDRLRADQARDRVAEAQRGINHGVLGRTRQPVNFAGYRFLLVPYTKRSHSSPSLLPEADMQLPWSTA